MTWRSLVLAVAAAASPLTAQSAFVGGGAAAGRLRFAAAEDTPALTGPLVSVEAGSSTGMFFVTARYAQGTLTSGALSSAVVAGEALVGMAPVPWLAIDAGPSVKSLSNGVREQWFFWVAHARAVAPLAGDGVRSYFDVRRSVGGHVNLPGDTPSDAGVAVGLLVGSARGPLSLSMGYEIDHVAIGGGPERIMERLALSLQFGRRGL